MEEEGGPWRVHVGEGEEGGRVRPAAGTTEAGGSRTGAGEREAGRWADLRGWVQLAVEREGMTGGPETGNENKEKGNGFNSNLKLIL
jgi:hypothetical protein